MLGWFRALLPREDKFFDLFERHSRILVAGAEALQKLLDGGEDVERHCRRIVELENQADAITRDVLLAVRRASSPRSTAATSRTSSSRWTTPST